MPVAVLPDGKACSWYGGTRTHWTNVHLEFAKRAAQQGFVEAVFVRFAMLVDESAAKILDKQRLLESEAGVILIPDDIDPIAAHKELEAYNAEWRCFGGGIPTDHASVKYWLRKARAGGVPNDSYDVGKADDDN